MKLGKELTLQCGDVDIRAVQRGESPRALFLHGFGGDLQTWNPLWAELDEGLSMLRYDLRGFGASRERDDRAFSHADDLLALLDAFELPQADLVGVSMGGAVALNFALAHPRRVRRLVLISPAITAWEWSGEWRDLWQAIVDCARDGDMDGARELWWLHPLFATVRDGEAGQSLRAAIDRFPGRQWLADHQRPSLPDLEKLHSLAVPALLMSGGRDLGDFRLIADLLTAAVPDLRRIDFPGAGHMLHLEEPAVVARELLAFLEGDC